MNRARLPLFVPCLAVLALGCFPRLPTAGSARSTLPGAPTGQSKCRVAASENSPLVTEWPASEKANLEVLLRAGVVAVAYSGCSMRVLPQCQIPGSYHWQRTTPATDTLEINNEDELFARLPLGAASLEGELKRSGKLEVQTTVSGQLKLDGRGVPGVPAEGPCAQATHLVGALSVGAFTLSSGAAAQGKATVNVTSIGEAGGGSNRSASVMRAAGDAATCGSGSEQAPHPNCASPIQVFLLPLPGRVSEEGPPGAVKVDFVSGNPASRWDVYADDQVICTTPCARWIDPHRPVALRTREAGFLQAPDRVQVDNLLGYPGQQHLQLQAHGTANGKLATGIVFTSFSGMAVLSGISLTGLGCSTDRSTMCKAGMITMGAGAVALAGSIYLILDSRSRAEVRSHENEPGYQLALPPRLLVGPGFVAGRF
jgi:hypothetical protein